MTAVRPAAPLRPDPRILARRIEVRRSEGRRRLRRLLWALGAVAAVAAALALTRTPLLDVDRVRVEGVARVPVGEVLEAAAAAGAADGTPLLDVDAGAVERAIEALPGVADASVERTWRGTVTVAVVERLPVALVRTGDGAALVAADGVVVDVVPAPPSGLPALAVDAGALEPGAVVEAEDLVATAGALPPPVAAAVAAVAPGPATGEVALHLAGGGTVRLGPPADLGAKLVAVATMLEQADLGCLAVLDVRVPSAPAVTRLAGCLP